MNKKILISLCIIGAVAAIAVGGTIAYYNDTETSSGNIFTAGTLNLQVGDSDPTGWNFQIGDIKPGDSGFQEVILQNTGSLDGYLHITFANLINDEMGCTEPEGQPEGIDITCENPGPNQGELAQNLDVLIYLDEDTSGTFTLGTDTLIYQGKVKGVLQGDIFNYLLAKSVSKKFRIEWKVDSSVGNIVQSDKTGYDIVFELTQNKQEEIVGDWHLDENAGTVAYDSSGWGNNGAINGAGWTGGKYNPALSLDGLNDNIVVNDSDSLKPEKVTLEAWVKRDGTPGVYKYIAGKSYGGGWGSYHLYTGPSGGLKFYIGHNGGYIASPDAGTGIWDNSWHHITGTYDGSIVKLYVDGAEIPGGTGATQDIAYNTENFYIGSYGNGYYFSGLVDEVRVYSRDLSAGEISARYQTGL
jgi:predicted ribosomally synthesized peptide with SipW-like signal peptide